MKIRTLLATMLVLVLARGSSPSRTNLVGCPSAAALAGALAEIQKSNWREVSAERVSTIWPAHFDELKCESEKPCRLLVSKSRVISGHCECCETFEFDVNQNKDDAHKEHLYNIIIHYSSATKRSAIDAARALAKGAGLPPDKIETVGSDSVQTYEWTDSSERVRQSYLAELHLTRVGTHWELYFAFTASVL